MTGTLSASNVASVAPSGSTEASIAANARPRRRSSKAAATDFQARQVGRWNAPLFVYRGDDGELMISDGVTRATRVAKLLPGILVTVEVIGRLKGSLGHLPTVGDKLP